MNYPLNLHTFLNGAGTNSTKIWGILYTVQKDTCNAKTNINLT